ncbi:MAG: alkylhydroperoxidase like protein, AhpD family [Acidobacteria bacterium]|jgi:AhpD family alkylhydroperoxidase|nr:alkylhydroperoxidase like protein, AhpD family [Acidobacteriota bacterium]
MGHWHDVSAALADPSRSLRSAIPDAWAGFAQMHKEAMKEGVISAAMKEVIALVISVRDECDGCIAAHARGAARKGATPEQVAEALGVALTMMGGPGTVYGPRAWEAYQEYRAQQPAPQG